MLKFLFLSCGLFFLMNYWTLLIFVLFLAVMVWGLTMENFNLGMVNLIQLDYLSYMLGELSLWILVLMILMSFYIKSNENFPLSFVGLSVSMLIFLLLSFSTSDLLLFYIAFEATLIPIFLLVMGWGYQPERVTASYFLLFYTLAASLPLLLSILYMNYNDLSLDYAFFSHKRIYLGVIFWGMIMAFMVKLPVYFGHLWLPKAHVEAPVAGSMILAGVLLKLGGYGMIRVSSYLEGSLNEYASLLISISLIGGIISSLICIRQTDCKSLVAYSSVAHMALVLVGVVINTYLSVSGAIIIMVAHGLCSSGLFSLVGMVYERLGTRSILLIRGMITMAPLSALWWFLFSVSNMAAPPTPNLLGEIYLFMVTLSWWGVSAVGVGFLSFLAGAYNLYLFVSTQHGGEVSSLSLVSDFSLREHVVLMLHLAPFLLLFPFLTHFYS
uniref:NADH-ubiquinone oxidoreductase chain 4 n=1 Tax=Daphnia laevis TaxID=42853 RepID=A0A5Q0RZX3_9CRUS|nr:NADH dehydrogenase subunit 4 [Daphnia laevis]QGA47450.1 NADH dehydrogenase subunit 4 [Daphnia laevis]